MPTNRSQVILMLWVSNQAGCSCDCTNLYIQASGFAPPAGVVLDAKSQTLRGKAAATWRAYQALAKAVARAGHGLDDAEAELEAGEPRLTACPSGLVSDGYMSAMESLARRESPAHSTWSKFVASIPCLTAELARSHR